jgi:hypothetical protein
MIGLIELLTELDQVQAPLTNSQVSVSVQWIKSIASLMAGMYMDDLGRDQVSLWTAGQFKRSAKNFSALCIWLYFPQPGTLGNLHEYLTEYLNTFLTGYYHELPREELPDSDNLIGETPRQTWTRKVGNFVMLVGFMALPIAALSIIGRFFRFEIPVWAQSSATVLYVIWAALGILFFSEHLTPEGKELLNTVLKGVIPKGQG